MHLSCLNVSKITQIAYSFSKNILQECDLGQNLMTDLRWKSDKSVCFVLGGGLAIGCRVLMLLSKKSCERGMNTFGNELNIIFYILSQLSYNHYIIC